MDTSNTVIGKDGYPFVVNSGGHDNHNNEFAHWAGINETHRTGTAVIDALTNSTNVINKGVYDASVAGIKQTTDAAASTTKNVTDYGMANSDATHRSATAMTKAITDASLSASLAVGELRGNIATIGTANAVSAKDIQIAIFKDGAHTREDVCGLAKDTAKGFADAALLAAQNKASIELEALRNKCELSAQSTAILAKVNGLKEEICCCIKEAAAGTEIKRLESALLDSKFAALGKGNS